MNSPAADSTSFNALYTTVQSNVQLPIELLYFNAEPAGDIVICKWETATETNNERFEVEKSLDSKNFEFIGKVLGCGPGNCPESRSYSLIDNEKCSGIIYYRLKQVDIDGNYSYSDVVALDCSKELKSINVHPNPAQSTITVSFNESADCMVTIRIIDYTGRIILNQIVSAQKGFNQEHISVEGLSDGAYYLDLQSNDINNSDHRQIRFFKELK
jgi:hypothetical protein